MAVRVSWANRVLGSVNDSRGWARYGGVILQGASGSVVFISMYAPAFSADAADVQWQFAQIARMDGGINITP